MVSELWQFDTRDLARLIGLGRASAREATECCLAQPRAVNPQLNAVVTTFDDEALSTADAAQARGDMLGPLHGVPVTVKVNTDQKEKGHATPTAWWPFVT
jgi:amidase